MVENTRSFEEFRDDILKEVVATDDANIKELNDSQRRWHEQEILRLRKLLDQHLALHRAGEASSLLGRNGFSGPYEEWTYAIQLVWLEKELRDNDRVYGKKKLQTDG